MTENAHTTNPYYSATPAPGFAEAIQASYAALNARKESQYQSELVPLSNKPGAPLIPQYRLPLDN